MDWRFLFLGELDEDRVELLGYATTKIASTTNSPNRKHTSTPIFDEIDTKTIHTFTAIITNPDVRPLMTVLVVVLVVVALVGCRAC